MKLSAQPFEKLLDIAFRSLVLAALLLITTPAIMSQNTSGTPPPVLPPVTSGGVTLAWDASPEATGGYALYYARPGDPAWSRQVVTAATDTLRPVAGGQYSFYVTAIGSLGLESAPSNILQVTIPSPVKLSVKQP